MSTENKQRIKKFIRKNKYVSYVILGIAGVILIVWGAAWMGKGSPFYDVFVGVGASLVATVVVSFVLLISLPDESILQEKEDELKKWGIEKIVSERKNIKISQKNLPKKSLDFTAFGLSHFVKANKTSTVVPHIKKGLTIRILVPNPDTRAVREQQRIENSGNIKAEIEELVKWVRDIQAALEKEKDVTGAIELKQYDSLPLNFYCRADDRVYVGAYMPGTQSGDVLTYQFQYYSKGGNYYSELFEKFWSGEEPQLRVSSQMQEYLWGNQREAIESVMRYFCANMVEAEKIDVIGAVVIFKDELRRTFFSCNKPHEERNVCHWKTEGAIGAMLELNEGDVGKRDFWRDYENNLAFMHQKYRTEKTIKISKSNKKLKQEETVGILVIPLIVEKNMIGAVTFDFAHFPEKYQQEVGELLKMHEEEAVGETSQVSIFFSKANICADIVIKMLGNDIDMAYTQLIEERWNENA